MQRLTWFGLMLIFTRNVTKKILKFYYEIKILQMCHGNIFTKLKSQTPKTHPKKVRNFNASVPKTKVVC